MKIRQGDLDYLCGVYAVINACNALRHLTSRDRRKLFKRLIKALEEQCGMASAIIYGTRTRHVEMMLKIAVKHMQRRHGLVITVTKPFKGQKRLSLNAYWERMQQLLGAGHATALVGMEGVMSHWVCVKAITDSMMFFADSVERQQVRKSNCRISRDHSGKHNYLTAKHTWVITITK